MQNNIMHYFIKIINFFSCSQNIQFILLTYLASHLQYSGQHCSKWCTRHKALNSADFPQNASASCTVMLNKSCNVVRVVKGLQACLMTLANAKLTYKLHIIETVFCSAIFLMLVSLCYSSCWMQLCIITFIWHYSCTQWYVQGLNFKYTNLGIQKSILRLYIPKPRHIRIQATVGHTRLILTIWDCSTRT